MNEKKNIKERAIVLSIILLVLLVILLPIKVPHNVDAMGSIISSKEWILSRGPDGRLMTSLINNKTGMYENYTVSQFQRGDAIEFNLRKGIVAGIGINKLDTIANIYSNETEKKILKLQGDLAIEKANLNISTGPQKQSVIDEAKKKLDYARRQLLEQERLFIRDAAQFESELISKEDYEISKGAVELFKINVQIAEEKLNTVSTGAKSEEINLIEAKITSLENEISILYDKFSQFILLSPITGIIERSFSHDTLLVISDTTEYLIMAPITMDDYKYVTVGDEVDIYVDQFDVILTGKVYATENKVRFANNNPYYITYIEIIDKINLPLLGLRIETEINCSEIPLRNYFLEFLNGGF